MTPGTWIRNIDVLITEPDADTVIKSWYSLTCFCVSCIFCKLTDLGLHKIQTLIFVGFGNKDALWVPLCSLGGSEEGNNLINECVEAVELGLNLRPHEKDPVGLFSVLITLLLPAPACKEESVS